MAAMTVAASVTAAELPARYGKAKPPDGLKHCNIGGVAGVWAANGVCVRISGYISAGFAAGHIK